MFKCLGIATVITVASFTMPVVFAEAPSNKVPASQETLTQAHAALEDNVLLPTDVLEQCNEQAPFLKDKTLLWATLDAENMFVASASAFLCPFFVDGKIVYTETDEYMTLLISEESQPQPLVIVLLKIDEDENVWTVSRAGDRLLMTSEDDWIKGYTMLQRERLGRIEHFMEE